MIRQGYGTPTLAKPSKEFVKHKRQSLSPEDSLTRKLNRQSSAFSPPSRGLGRGSKVPPPKSPYGGEAAIFSRSVSRGGEIAANAAESAGCNSIPGLKGMIDDIFDAADTNKDGRVDIDESYVLILKLYIKVLPTTSPAASVATSAVATSPQLPPPPTPPSASPPLPPPSPPSSTAPPSPPSPPPPMLPARALSAAAALASLATTSLAARTSSAPPPPWRR